MSERTEDAESAVDPLVTAVEQFGAPDRLRVLGALRTADRTRDDLVAATGLAGDELSATLTDLEAAGLVDERTSELSLLETEYECSQELTGTVPEDAGAPVETTYALTEKGGALEPVFEAVEEWTVEWVDGRSASAATVDE